MSSERFYMKIACILFYEMEIKYNFVSLREGTGWKDGWYSVAGHVEAGEAVEEAMVREAQEEAGINVYPKDLRHVFTMHRKSDDSLNDYIDIFFECHSWGGEVHNNEPGEMLRSNGLR